MNTNKSKRIFLPMLLVLSFYLLSACAGTPSSPDTLPVMVSAENPVEMVNQLGGKIADARKNQLNVLSPTWYSRAENSYLKAKNDLEKGKELSEIREYVKEAEIQLQKANRRTFNINRKGMGNTIIEGK